MNWEPDQLDEKQQAHLQDVEALISVAQFESPSLVFTYRAPEAGEEIRIEFNRRTGFLRVPSFFAALVMDPEALGFERGSAGIYAMWAWKRSV